MDLRNNFLSRLFNIPYASKPEGNTVGNSWGNDPNYKTNDFWDFYGKFSQVSNLRSRLLEDYIFISDDEVVGTAIDTMAEDATQIDESTGRSISVKSPHKGYKELCEQVLQSTQIEDLLPAIAIRVVRDGECFVKVYGKNTVGVTHLEIRPANSVVRLEKDGEICNYYDLMENAKNTSERKRLSQPWEFIHFRNPGAADIIDDLRPRNLDFSQFDRTAKYGTSMIYRAIRPAKRMNLALDTLFMARITKSQTTRIHYVEVANSTLPETGKILNSYKSLFKTKERYDTTSNYYKAEYNPLEFGADRFIPVRDGKGKAEITTLGGDVDVTSIIDIEKFEERLFAALGVPRAYIFNAAEQSQSLLQLDIRYARRVMRVQKAIITGLTELCQIHLGYKFRDPNPELFTINLVSVSSINDTERNDILGAVLDVIQKLWAFIVASEVQIDKKELLKYIVSHFLRLPNFNIDELFVEEPAAGATPEPAAGATPEAGAEGAPPPDAGALPPDQAAASGGTPPPDAGTPPPADAGAPPAEPQTASLGKQFTLVEMSEAAAKPEIKEAIGKVYSLTSNKWFMKTKLSEADLFELKRNKKRLPNSGEELGPNEVSVIPD